MIPIHTVREQWLARRRELITASDVAAIIGVDRFRTPSDVYADKLGLGAFEETEAMRWGRRLEPSIAEAYADATQRDVVAEPEYHIAIHPDIPWLGATLDRGVLPTDTGEPAPALGRGALELKATEFAAQWTDDPPVPYVVQLTIQMACTSRQWGSLAAFVSLFQPVVWVDRVFDRELFDLIVPRLEVFRHAVLTKTPPRNDPEWFSRAALRKIFPSDDGTAVALDHDALAVVELWEEARRIESEARIERESAEDELRARLGPASLGYLPDGTTLTLKTTAETEIKSYTRAAFRTLRRFRPRPKGRK